MQNTIQPVRGRFAPSPSGRMHLGNIFCAIICWLSARSAGGSLVLRIEDLDTLRCTKEESGLPYLGAAAVEVLEGEICLARLEIAWQEVKTDG